MANNSQQPKANTGRVLEEQRSPSQKQTMKMDRRYGDKMGKITYGEEMLLALKGNERFLISCK